MAVHPQVDLYTQKVEAFMAKYPKVTGKDFFQSLHDKTGYPGAWFFVVACACLVALITVIGGAKLLVDVVGFVYPAYMSFKSIDGNETKKMDELTKRAEETQWLTYWVCFSFLSLLETTFAIVTRMIPLYYWLKIAIVVWMWYPSSRGAQTIYDQVLRPVLVPYLDAAKKADAATTAQKEK